MPGNSRRKPQTIKPRVDDPMQRKISSFFIVVDTANSDNLKQNETPPLRSIKLLVNLQRRPAADKPAADMNARSQTVIDLSGNTAGARAPAFRSITVARNAALNLHPDSEGFYDTIICRYVTKILQCYTMVSFAMSFLMLRSMGACFLLPYLGLRTLSWEGQLNCHCTPHLPLCSLSLDCFLLSFPFS